MQGQKGDWIEIDAVEVGAARRKGQIVEVLGEPGHEHYRVRWEDDHVSVFFPGSSTHVIHKNEHVSRA